MLISLYDVKCRPEGWRQVRLDSAEPERVLDSQIGALIYECHGCQPAVWAREWRPMRDGRWAALVDLAGKIVCRLGACGWWCASSLRCKLDGGGSRRT